MKTQSILVLHKQAENLVCSTLCWLNWSVFNKIEIDSSGFQLSHQVLSNFHHGQKTQLISFISIGRLLKASMYLHICMNGLILYLGRFLLVNEFFVSSTFFCFSSFLFHYFYLFLSWWRTLEFVCISALRICYVH